MPFHRDPCRSTLSLEYFAVARHRFRLVGLALCTPSKSCLGAGTQSLTAALRASLWAGLMLPWLAFCPTYGDCIRSGLGWGSYQYVLSPHIWFSFYGVLAFEPRPSWSFVPVSRDCGPRSIKRDAQLRPLLSPHPRLICPAPHPLNELNALKRTNASRPSLASLHASRFVAFILVPIFDIFRLDLNLKHFILLARTDQDSEHFVPGKSSPLDAQQQSFYVQSCPY